MSAVDGFVICLSKSNTTNWNLIFILLMIVMKLLFIEGLSSLSGIHMIQMLKCKICILYYTVSKLIL